MNFVLIRSIPLAIVLSVPSVAHAIPYPQIVLGGPTDGHNFRVMIQVSTVLDQDSHWNVSLYRTGQNGITVNDPDWNRGWTVEEINPEKYSKIGPMLKAESSFQFSLPSKGSRQFTLKGTGEMMKGWMRITEDPSRLPDSPASSLSVSTILQLWKGNEFEASVGMIAGVWNKEQVSIPVSFSEQANTGVAWIVIREGDDGQDPDDVLFTLFDGNGQETARITESCPSVCQRAKFINEIFPDVPMGFQGTLRISIMDGVDDPLTVSDEEWERRKRAIQTSRSWIAAAALRMDTVSSGAAAFSSVPVQAGLPRFRPASLSGSQYSIEGVPLITDGDTLKIQGEPVRMDGIDAPEASQMCIKDGQAYPCGWQASEVLRSRISGSEVICRYSDRDQYQRIVGTCFVESENLSHWIVRNGWALAYRKYSTDYIEEEERAKSEKLGIWSSEFIEPWNWRRGERLNP